MMGKVKRACFSGLSSPAGTRYVRLTESNKPAQCYALLVSTVRDNHTRYRNEVATSVGIEKVHISIRKPYVLS